ncbi:MAG TPA: glycosyltransferase family 4 protein [Candidatus Limnocylindria bacterium]|nr:glycosyltransferase family 4 protein [Candidatus Limnocylindria bacterium]
MTTDGTLLVVAQRYGDVAGGAEWHARELVRHLVPHFRIKVATTTATDYWTWKNDLPIGEELVDGVTVRRFPVDRGRARDFRRRERAAFNPGRSLEDERRFIEAQGPVTPDLLEYVASHVTEYDAILFFTYIYYPTAYGVALAPDRAILVPTAHDEPVLSLTTYRRVFHAPRAIAYNTAEERDLVQARFGNERVPHEVVGVGVERPADVSGDRFRNGFGIGGPILLYVGRVVPSKGCDRLFSDFARWKDDGNGHRGTLVVLGKAEMPIPVRPDIRHLGYARDADKWDAYDAADVVVMPSRLESLSIVALEAWSAGKPLLCHAGSAVLRSMSRRSGGGVFYRDYDEFGALLDLLLGDAGLRATLGAGGRAFVDRTYTWPVVVQKYRDLIAEVRVRNR